MMRPRTWFGFAACSLLVTSAPLAHANGRYPQSNALEVSPFNASNFILRTTFGFMFSYDKGKTWKWVCEPAAAAITTEDPSISIFSNRVIAGTEEGLTSTVDNGCNWKIPDTTPVIDVVTRPNAPSSALILRSKSVASDSGALTYINDVLQTTDNGTTYAALGVTLDPKLLLETIEVSASDPTRIYISGFEYNPDGSTRGYVLTSKDSGAHYTTVQVPLLTGEDAPFISAVDPKNPDRVYVRTGDTIDDTPKPGDLTAPAKPMRLLVSDDGGSTFRTVFTGKNILYGFALSPDGTKVYVGGHDDGVQVASTTDFKFTQTSTIHVFCLRSTADALYACSDEPSGFVLGSSTDDGAHFDAMMHLQCTVNSDTLLACPKGSSVDICTAVPQGGGLSPLDLLGETNRTGYTDQEAADYCAAFAAGDLDASTEGGTTGSVSDASTGPVDGGMDGSTSSGNGASSGDSSSGGCSYATRAPFSWGAAAGNVVAIGAIASLLRRRRNRRRGGGSGG